jgi:hypothetical protein
MPRRGQKQRSQRISLDDARKTADSTGAMRTKNAIVNLIQMKSMEVMGTPKNMIIQEFQYHTKFGSATMLKSYESICD